jgi:hypothetical protein
MRYWRLAVSLCMHLVVPSQCLQTFAERLFWRLQQGNERFETRMAMMNVVSRVIGVHK